MAKCTQILALLVLPALLPFFARDALAQACTFDWTIHYEPLTRLFNDFDPNAGNGDSFTVPLWLSSSGNDLRETWYIPADAQVPGTAPLYRFFNSGVQDHMDRPDPAGVPGAYVLDPQQPLGYPWEDFHRDGLTVMRTWIGTPFDHRTWLHDQAPSAPGISYVVDATFNPASGNGRLGYQRFGNPLPFQQMETFATYTLSNDILSLEFNRVWGNVLQKVTHLASGKQFIDPGIGDLVSSLIRFAVPEPTCHLANPTQAGGARCLQYGSTQYWAGSPVLVESLDADSLISIVRPLEFCHAGQHSSGGDPWPNGDLNEILAWNGLFQRSDQLGCFIGGTERQDVVASRFTAMLSEHHSLASQSVTMTTSYFIAMEDIGNAHLGDFTMEWVDLETGVTTPIDYQDAGGNVLWNTDFEFPVISIDHALVVTPASGVGFAIASLESGASTDDFILFSLRCEGGPQPNCPVNRQEILIDVKRRNTILLREEMSLPVRSYMVVNDRATMLSRLDEIVAADGDCALGGATTIFGDGFESGDLSAWSSSTRNR